MLSNALEATRSWSAGLNRLGWGCVASLLVAWLVGLGDDLTKALGSEGSLSASLLLSSLFLLLSSGLFGSIVVSLGSLAEPKRFSLHARISLAERVGSHGNGLLIQFYNEATFRFEMAAGFRGTLLFSAFCFVLKLMVGSPETTHLSFEPRVSWPASAGIIFALAFDWLLTRSSTEAFDVLDRVIQASPTAHQAQVAPISIDATDVVQ